ncbi:MAG: sugar phosphate isomerase/epimerase [Clostridia bacterium]|nr:sugar phosphate isomerase/epimerase [Clostridia bacterium]
MHKVSIQSYPFYNHDKALESLEYIKARGFEAIDYNINTYLNGKDVLGSGVKPSIFDKTESELIDFFKPLKEASEKTGVIITQMHATYPAWEQGKYEANDYIHMALDKTFAVCEYLNCPHIVVHPLDGATRQEEWERNLNLFEGLIPLIKKRNGVKICIENIFGRRPGRTCEGRLSNALEAAKLIDYLNDKAGGDYFGFCFDVGHSMLSRRDIYQFLLDIGSRLSILHIHENNGDEDLHCLPFTCVNTADHLICDWNGFIKGLKDINYKGDLSFETAQVLKRMPAPTHDKVYELICEMGKYFVSEIEK